MGSVRGELVYQNTECSDQKCEYTEKKSWSAEPFSKISKSTRKQHSSILYTLDRS